MNEREQRDMIYALLRFLSYFMYHSLHRSYQAYFSVPQAQSVSVLVAFEYLPPNIKAPSLPSTPPIHLQFSNADKTWAIHTVWHLTVRIIMVFFLSFINSCFPLLTSVSLLFTHAMPLLGHGKFIRSEMATAVVLNQT